MPTNVPPQWRALEEEYRQATDHDEKIRLLEELLRTVPKHKATDRLQADLKSKLAKLRKEPKKKAGAGAGPSHTIAREGAGQIALVGPPNGGKSSLLAALTHAEPRIADYPFTTREPQPGMMRHEDVPIQLVDLPPLSDEHVEPWVYDNIRRADVVWLVSDSGQALDGVELCLRLTDPKHVGLVPAGREVDGEGKPMGWMPKPTFLVVTGMDKPDAAGNLEILRELLEIPFPVFPVSAPTLAGTPELAAATWNQLGRIRIYTKEPGKEVDRTTPFIVPLDSTVEDLARHIHKDLAERLKFAKVWGTGVFDGQQVHAEHTLHDKDVVELHD